jgi:O-antigen ligase
MLRTLYILLVCYLPIVEPFIPKTDFGAGMPDIGATRLLSYLIVLTFLFISAIKLKARFYNTWIVFLAAYSIYVIASVAWSNHYSYNVTLIQAFFNTVLMPLIIAVIALNLFETQKNIDFYVKNLIIASVILSVIAIFQIIFGNAMVGGFRRSMATFSNPNALAIFLVLVIPCLNYAMDKGLINRKLGWAILVLIILGLITTVSRKGIVTGAIAFFLYYMLKKNYQKALFIGILAILLVGVFSQARFVSVRFESRFMKHSFEKKASHREIGLRMFRSSPLFGLGYKGYYENYGDFKGEPGRKYDPHNIFITALTDYGLVGFTLLMCIFIYPLLYSIKIILSGKKGDENSAFEMAVICITTVIPLMINGFFAGRLLFKPDIMFILYTQIIFVFQRDRLQFSEKKTLDA